MGDTVFYLSLYCREGGQILLQQFLVSIFLKIYIFETFLGSMVEFGQISKILILAGEDPQTCCFNMKRVEKSGFKKSKLSLRPLTPTTDH